MSKAFTLKQLPNTRSEFILNTNKAIALGLDRKKQAYISFGSRKHYVDVKVSDSLTEDNILLSKNLADQLLFPEYTTYEIRTDKNEITLGPFIGLLVKNKDESLNENYLDKMLLHVRDYAKLNGAIVVFALDKVDSSKQLIEGYCYNPLSGYWQRGVFPYPCAIYRTIGLDTQWKNHFLSTIGDRLFNNRYFNKREMHEWFSADPSINAYLPYTMLYESYQDIPDMVDRFGTIYIKPITGLKGRGIVRVGKKEGAVVFEYREGGKNKQLALENPEEIRQFAEHCFKNRKYLIQQAIQLIRFEGRIADFRCVLQKDQSGLWKFMAMFGRCGEKGSVVSNISSGGTVFVGDNLLKKVISPYKLDFYSIQDEIHRLAFAVCTSLDEMGFHCGVLGLDIGVDIHGQLWLIEINNRDPSMVFALDMEDDALYFRLKTNPVLYAKALSGFKSESNNIN